MSSFFLFSSNKGGSSPASKFPSIVLLLFGFSKGREVGEESFSGVGVGVVEFSTGFTSSLFFSQIDIINLIIIHYLI